jgi:hypothetical protein
MAQKDTFTYYLTIDIEAMNDESAMKKLEAWIEPTLALKKNADLNLSAIEFDEPEESEEEAEPEASPSIVKSALATKKRPELKVPQKDEFDYDNIPDWEELGEDVLEKPKVILPGVEEEDDELSGLLAGLDDDEEEETPDEDEDEDEDDDWNWDDDESW